MHNYFFVHRGSVYIIYQCIYTLIVEKLKQLVFGFSNGYYPFEKPKLVVTITFPFHDGQELLYIFLQYFLEILKRSLPIFFYYFLCVFFRFCYFLITISCLELTCCLHRYAWLNIMIRCCQIKLFIDRCRQIKESQWSTYHIGWICAIHNSLYFRISHFGDGCQWRFQLYTWNIHAIAWKHFFKIFLEILNWYCGRCQYKQLDALDKVNQLYQDICIQLLFQINSTIRWMNWNKWNDCTRLHS